MAKSLDQRDVSAGLCLVTLDFRKGFKNERADQYGGL
jgi:hypothetical protein